MRLPFLLARPPGNGPSVAEIARRAPASPPKAPEGGRDHRDKAFYLVVLEVIPPERPQS